ncbi:unnamed protein product [Pylaiella littoralis]
MPFLPSANTFGGSYRSKQNPECARQQLPPATGWVARANKSPEYTGYHSLYFAARFRCRVRQDERVTQPHAHDGRGTVRVWTVAMWRRFQSKCFLANNIMCILFGQLLRITTRGVRDPRATLPGVYYAMGSTNVQCVGAEFSSRGRGTCWEGYSERQSDQEDRVCKIQVVSVCDSLVGASSATITRIGVHEVDARILAYRTWRYSDLGRRAVDKKMSGNAFRQELGNRKLEQTPCPNRAMEPTVVFKLS